MRCVSIITGALGSGKTTLLNHWLRHERLARSLVIVNEMGEIGLDHLLVAAPSDNVRVLRNGCLCCEVRGEFVQTLQDVAGMQADGRIPAFERILVETTGMADPVPIVRAILDDPQVSRSFRLDAIVCVVDAAHGLNQIESLCEVVKQIAVADVVLLAKTDLVPAAQRVRLERVLATINPGAPLLAVAHGALDPAQALERDGHTMHRRDLRRWLSACDALPPAAGALHEPAVQRSALTHDAPVSEHALRTWLGLLASFWGPWLLRVKGIVNVDGEPWAVHVVQCVIHDPEPLPEWPDADRRSRFVFIFRGLDPASIENSLAVLSAPAPGALLTSGFDACAYARFHDLASLFVGAQIHHDQDRRP